MGIVKCFNCGKKSVAVSDSVCPYCGNVLSHVKLSFFEYIGSPYSLSGYQHSYKLVLLKSILEEINKNGKANSFAVVSRFRKYYEKRIMRGLPVDKNADSRIEKINKSTTSEIFDIIKTSPYSAIKKHGFLDMTKEGIGGDFVFCEGLNDLSNNERNNIIDLLDQKLKLYYKNLNDKNDTDEEDVIDTTKENVTENKEKEAENVQKTLKKEESSVYNQGNTVASNKNIKKDFFDYLGKPDSLNGYQRSYKLVLIKSIFEEINKNGRANSFAVVARFRNYYLQRIAKGFEADKDIDSRIKNINHSTTSEIFDVIKTNPYSAIKKHGFIKMSIETIGGDFIFCEGLDKLSEAERNEIIDLMNQKLKLYYDKIDQIVLENEKAINVKERKELLETKTLNEKNSFKDSERKEQKKDNDAFISNEPKDTVEAIRQKEIENNNAMKRIAEIELFRISQKSDNKTVVEKAKSIDVFKEPKDEEKNMDNPFALVPIEQVGLSQRAYNAAKRADINTAEKLIELVENKQIYNIPKIGAVVENEMIATVTRLREREMKATEFEDTSEKNEKEFVSEIDKIFPENIFYLFRVYCKNKNITRIEQLQDITQDDLMSIRGLGTGKINKIVERFEQIGKIAVKKQNVEKKENNKIIPDLKESFPFKKIHATNKKLGIDILCSFKASHKTIRKLKDAEVKTIGDLKKKSALELFQILDKNAVTSLCKICTAFEKNIKDVAADIIGKYEGSNKFDFYVQRAEGKTLQMIAEASSLTRERVRQICLKFEQEIYSAINIIVLSVMKDNKAYYITSEQLSEIFDDDRYDKIVLQIMKVSPDYIYLDFADVFVLKKKYPKIKEKLKEIAEQIVGDGINIFEKTEEIEESLNAAGYDFLGADDFLGLLISLNYKFYNDFVIKTKQSYGLLCANIIAEEFPEGIKISDENDLRRLRELCFEKYGDLGIPEENRPFVTRFCGHLIQSGKGEYTSPKNIYIEQSTLLEIKNYIDENERSEFYYKELFQEFEGLLMLTSNISNAAALHGILLYNYPKEYSYTRDYLIKLNVEKDTRSVAERISDVIFEHGEAMSRQEILVKLPYLTEISISLATGNSDELMQWETNQINTLLNIEITSRERKTISEIIFESFKNNKGYCSEGILYDKIIKMVPDFVNRNKIKNSQNAFYSVGAIFKNVFIFRRPHILRKDWPTEANMKDVANYLLGTPESFYVSEFNRLAEKMKWSRTTAGMALAELETEYLRISNDKYILKKQLKTTEADCEYLKNVLNDIPDWYVPASKFMNCDDFTPSGIEINEFSIEVFVKNERLGWKVICPKVKDKRYQKNVLVREECNIKEFDELISAVLKENGYKKISESALLVFMQVNGFALKYVPKELFNSDYFRVTEDGLEVI